MCEFIQLCIFHILNRHLFWHHTQSSYIIFISCLSFRSWPPSLFLSSSCYPPPRLSSATISPCLPLAAGTISSSRWVSLSETRFCLLASLLFDLSFGLLSLNLSSMFYILSYKLLCCPLLHSRVGEVNVPVCYLYLVLILEDIRWFRASI